MNITEQLKQNATQLGISLSHYDIDGHLIHASPETVSYFVDLLQPEKAFASSASSFSTLIFDDVLVIQEQQSACYQFDLSKFPKNTTITCTLLDEMQEVIDKKVLTVQEGCTINPLPYGYYSLRCTANNISHTVRLLVTPKSVYQPAVFQEKKAWGINVQLYSLRSERNWGIGDFADLLYLAEKSVPYAVDFIGINPLHAMYPSCPEWASPYSSSSRVGLNILYIAVDKLPEFASCKSCQQWFSQPEIQQKLIELRQAELVDYASVSTLKRTALELLFTHFKRSRAAFIAQRREAFNEFMQKQGDALLYQGLFNVLDSIEHQQSPQDENQIGWLGWRNEWQQLNEQSKQALLKKYQKEIQFFAWLQWLANEQLESVKDHCQALGMSLGIYGDLAVSSSRGSADVWIDPELYCVKASVGAPPDPLGPVGQNWNIPPYNPSVLKRRGFQPFIDMLRANMKHFAVLRIDHIMGLFRLWLIPEGKNASDGLYVHYPFQELMAILAIESQRHQCLIVGEDLGTVPDEVRSKLNELQIFSYFVLYFEQRHHQYPKGEHFPLRAFATVGTHDVPSLQSFWHCKDLELFAELGILQGELLQQKYDQRVIDKQALLNTLHRDQYLPEDYQGDALNMAMHEHLNRVIHQYVAESQTQLIGVQLENLLSQEVSFNLPGTSEEYPNWRKKLTYTLENLFENEYIPSFLTQIHQARNK